MFSNSNRKCLISNSAQLGFFLEVGISTSWLLYRYNSHPLGLTPEYALVGTLEWRGQEQALNYAICRKLRDWMRKYFEMLTLPPNRQTNRKTDSERKLRPTMFWNHTYVSRKNRSYSSVESVGIAIIHTGWRSNIRIQVITYNFFLRILFKASLAIL